MEKIRIGISACLLGERVRYDGGHKQDHYLTETLASYIEWRPVCPETECGLGAPREVMHLKGDALAPRLMTITSGLDHTDRLAEWTKMKLRALTNDGLCGFVFKARSPSCGLSVRLHNAAGNSRNKTRGLFAAAYVNHFPLMPVEEEGRLYDPAVRENFFTRVFAYRRWSEHAGKDNSLSGLIGFHARHKLLLLAHSPSHYRALGRLLASPGNAQENIHTEYIVMFMDALRLVSTVRKNTNVLQHMAGYFKKRLSTEEKQELQEIIERYRRGLVPLLAPVCLIRQYAAMYSQSYLMTQWYRYLFSDPLEQMLGNHG